MDEVLQHHRAAVARGAKCQACPLYGCGQGPVMGNIRPGSVMTVVGEAPGLSEVEEGRPFIGASGEVLNEALQEGGLPRDNCSVTNAILCRPPGGHMLDYQAELKRKWQKEAAKAKAEKREVPPLVTPQDCCAPRLATDLAEAGTKVVLALGSEALKMMAKLWNLPFAGAKAAPGQARVATIKKQHGSPVVVGDGRVLLSALHPAFAMHGSPTFMPIIREDIQRAARIALRGGAIDWAEPSFIIKPSADTCVNVLERIRASGAMVTVDIETNSVGVMTADIRCVGLGAVVDGQEVVIVVPLKHMTGAPWWRPGDEQRVKTALSMVLEQNPLAGHNLLFDTAVLLQHRLLLTRGKRWFDCYLDDETEFLTDRGWLKYDDVKPADKLATIAADNTLEWQQYTERVSKQRTGFLYEVETAYTRAVVTPGHTIWHQPRTRTADGMGDPTGPWQLTPAEKLVQQSPDSANILRACLPERDLPGLSTITVFGRQLNARDLKMLGLAVSDGTVRMHKGPYRLRISQKLNGRAYGFLQDSKLHYDRLVERQYEKKDAWRKTPCVETVWDFNGDRAWAEFFALWFGRKSVERRLPSWALTMPAEFRQALLDGLLLGDASEVGKATLYRTYSKGLADDVQALAVTLGVPATIHRAGQCFVVNLRLDLPVAQAVVTREREQSANGIFKRCEVEGEYRVVCFVVPNHTLVTRSGGRPAFHGNTMVAHHDTSHSELPHDLGFVAARYFEAPRWKDDADSKTVDGVDDYWLHLYCAKDVLGEMRLVLPLVDRVNKEGTAGALATDIKLAPVARDMGMLGLNIHEDTRHKFFKTLDAAGAERAAQIRSITGIPDFNPNAFKQVSKYLYVTKGLSPPYATDGREWDELAEDEEVPLDTDDPEVILAKAATNELSLLRLLELGVDDQTAKFIDTLLSYRGIQKCKSTYVGLKRDEETGGLIDTHRARGFILTETWGPHQNLSILHPSWKIHVTPTGRWATSPNVQNWPERVVYNTDIYKATDGKDGILNTRAMVRAPEGYILVGADYAAIELRMYAIAAQDKLLLDAIWTGKDPHCLNYATMMAKSLGDVDKWYDRLNTADPKVKKYKRMIAKRFCIAEGEPVLVRRAGEVLEVPIEKVEASDYVWDGLEWVSHDGVLDQGVKEVIYHDGLWATADHEVWVEDGRCIQHGEAAAQGLRLAQTSEAGRPLRFVGSHDSAGAEGEVSVRHGTLPNVLSGAERGSGQPAVGEVQRLPQVLRGAGRGAGMALRTDERSASTLHQSTQQGLEQVRREGYRVPVCLCAGCNRVGVDDAATAQGAATRQGGQQRALRAGKPALCLCAGQQHEPAQHEAAAGVDVQAGGVAVQGEARPQAAVCGADEGADTCTRTGVTPSARTKVVRVYDILNAGPRHRFTVSGRLVHNCFLVIYGGQKDKLYKTMAADRNPDGTRSFPDLKPGDVEMWFDNWHKGHPETKKWHEAVVRAWSSHGFVGTIIDGRRRFFIGGLDATAMPNMTIQGSAASIANRAMIKIAEACPYRGWGELAGPILQVHDFIGLQVPIARQKEAEELLCSEMPYEHGGMRFDVEQKSGPSWDKT